MRAVNLLPRDVDHGRKATRVPLVAGCAGAVVAASVLAGAYLQASSAVGGHNRQLAALEAQIAQVPQPPQQPATITALPGERQTRVTALASALSQRVAWDRILREISLVLPEDVWLQSLTASAPTAPTTAPTSAGSTAPTGFSIVGFTYSQASVARLLSRLDVLPDLEDVSLQSSSQTLVGTRQVVTFTIAGNVRPSGAAS